MGQTDNGSVCRSRDTTRVSIALSPDPLCEGLVHETNQYCVCTHFFIIITRIIKNIFNKNERRCRDVKSQKACEQG